MLQGRSVVDAVAGHGSDVAVCADSVHQANLMLRRYAGENIGGFHTFTKLFVSHFIDLTAFHRSVGFDAELGADGACGDLVVSGDHFHLDAGGLADVDGLLRFFTGRVDHADQADEDQVVFRFRRRIRLVHETISDTDHAQSGLGHILINAEDFFPLGVCKRINGSIFFDSRTTAEQLVRSALCVHGDVIADFVEGGHELSVRIKGNLLYTGIPGFPFGFLHAVLVGKNHHGGFRRIANDGLLVGIIGGVVAQQRAFNQTVRIGSGRAAGLVGDLTLRAVACSAYIIMAGSVIHFLDGHLVLGQRSGLIRTDNRGASQRFHRA